MTVDVCSSPFTLSKVVQGKYVSNFLLCHTRGFKLTSHLWAMGLGQLIYPTDVTCVCLIFTACTCSQTYSTPQ